MFAQIQKMRIKGILNDYFSNEKSISLFELDRNNISYNIVGFHLLINLLKYEGDIPEIKTILKNKKEESDYVDFMLEAPREKSDSEFYKKLETLVENYNSHHTESSLNIYFDKNNCRNNTAPSFPRTYLGNIPYLSIEPFLSEELIKETLKNQEKFITRHIIQKNLEKLALKIRNYLIERDKLLFAYPYYEPNELAKLFIDQLTEDNKQQLLKFSLTKGLIKTNQAAQEVTTQEVTTLQDFNKLLEILSSLTSLTTSQKLEEKLNEKKQFSFKLGSIPFIKEICSLFVESNKPHAKFYVNNWELKTYLKKYNKNIEQLSPWGISSELLKNSLDPENYVKLISAVKEITSESCVRVPINLEEENKQLKEENKQLKAKICELEIKLQSQKSEIAQSRPTFYR